MTRMTKRKYCLTKEFNKTTFMIDLPSISHNRMLDQLTEIYPKLLSAIEETGGHYKLVLWQLVSNKSKGLYNKTLWGKAWLQLFKIVTYCDPYRNLATRPLYVVYMSQIITATKTSTNKDRLLSRMQQIAKKCDV